MNPEHYAFIRATVGLDGNLRWEYKLNGSSATSMSHDEDVFDWSDYDIVKLTKEMLNVDDDDPVKIQVVRE